MFIFSQFRKSEALVGLVGFSAPALTRPNQSVSYAGLWGRKCFQAPAGCCQNLVPYNFRTEVPVSFLLTGSYTQLQEANLSVSCAWAATSQSQQWCLESFLCRLNNLETISQPPPLWGFSQGSYTWPLFSCPNHPRARYHTIRDSPYVPEPAEIISTSQS